jgi:HK97 family phage major capsid protein
MSRWAVFFIYTGVMLMPKKTKKHKEEIVEEAPEIIEEPIEVVEPEPEPEPEPVDVELEEKKSIDIVSFGGSVKALGNGRVGGYLVSFGDPEHTDIQGDFFTKDTDFGDVESSSVYYDHGLDEKVGKRVLGKARLEEDEFGVWAETQLKLRDEYEKFIYGLAEKGKMGWSSGTAGHLMERKKVTDNAYWITRWPLGLDASLTTRPAEPRNGAVPLKSLLPQMQELPKGEAEVSGDGTPSEGKQSDADIDKDGIPNEGDSNMAESTVDLQKLVDEASEKAAASAVAAFAEKLTTTNSGGFVQVTDDPADRPFKSMGEQLDAVKTATLSQGRKLHDRLSALNLKQLGSNELVGSEGGFLLEPSFVAEILKPLHESGPFSSRAAKLAIGPNANGVTVRAIDETSRATGSRWGGIQGYRLAEAATKTPSQPAFRLIEMRLKKYAVLCYATEELLQDTTALSGIIRQGASEELDFMVNDDIFRGLGVGGPLGITNSGALVTVAAEGGQLANTVVTENIVNMWARMHPRSKSNSVWYINTDVTPQLYLLDFVVGVGGHPAFMGPGSLPNSPSGTLLGRPVVETEFNASLGNVGDIVLADMSQYVMIDKDVQAASSIHVQFVTDQVAFRFVYRCDGQPKIAAPLTPYQGAGGGADTLSPFVALAARL